MDSRKLKQTQEIPKVSWNGLFSKGVPIVGDPLHPISSPINIPTLLIPTGGQPGVKGDPTPVPELLNLARKI